MSDIAVFRCNVDAAFLKRAWSSAFSETAQKHPIDLISAYCQGQAAFQDFRDALRGSDPNLTEAEIDAFGEELAMGVLNLLYNKELASGTRQDIATHIMALLDDAYDLRAEGREDPRHVYIEALDVEIPVSVNEMINALIESAHSGRAAYADNLRCPIPFSFGDF